MRMLNQITLLTTLLVAVAPTSELTAADPVKIISRGAPLRFQPKPIRQQAKIPAGVTFGFMCDMNGILMVGDWKASGIVTAVDRDAGIVQFVVKAFVVKGKMKDPRQEATLAYRLPHGMKLPFAVGNPITVMHDHDDNEKRMEWDIHISSEKRLVLATSLRHDDTPPRSAENAEVLFKGAPGGHDLFYWSNPDDDDLKQNNMGRSKLHSPTSLRTKDEGELTTMGTDKDPVRKVQLNGHSFYFVVLSSEHLEPDAHQDLHGEPQHGEPQHGKPQHDHQDDESNSHSLECFLLRAEEL